MERDQVLRTILAYRETVIDLCTSDPELAVRFYEDDPVLLDLLLELACTRTGVEPRAYERALAEDAALLDLQRLSLKEIVAEPADPGPYDEISRESPAGTPANYHLHPWNGITPVGGVGGSGPVLRRRA
jgi:hypothetical protein